jgi:DNA-binding CsgD family transcriptional regulator
LPKSESFAPVIALVFSPGVVQGLDDDAANTMALPESTRLPKSRREVRTKSRQTRSVGSGGAASRPMLLGRRSELATLDDLLERVRSGGSGATIVHGEPGIGKSALLERLVSSASDFAISEAAGVEREVDLPYAGLHQLCRPMIDTIAVLPAPQREELEVAFGLGSGKTPDRYLVGLAVLNLLSESARTQPLLCVVDDAQWLDVETTRALAFVARRLGADTVGLVIASRERLADFDGLPALELGGMELSDARLLLDSIAVGHLDEVVRERFLAETRGNPLAVLELPQTLTTAEAATGVLSDTRSIPERIEDGFRSRLAALPEQTRRLLVLAAAEPLGDPLLLLNASAHVGLGVDAADAAQEAGLLEIRERCSFRHPLVRSAVYRLATPQERRQAHAALAEVTDPQLDPDRRAWHLGQAAAVPAEEVAAELERTAVRAKSRGGLAGAAAFLVRAAQLTPDAGARTERAITAAQALFEAGAFDEAGALLQTLDPTRLSDLQAARTEQLHARVALAHGSRDETAAAVLKLVAAAEELRRLDPTAAQVAYQEALGTAWLRKPDLLETMLHSLGEHAESGPNEVVVLFFRGYSQMLRDGYPAGTELLRSAMLSLRESEAFDESDLPVLEYGRAIASSLWDFESWETLTRRQVHTARESGAFMMLPDALATWAEVKTIAGDLEEARAAFAEASAIAEATRNTNWPSTSMFFDALHLEGDQALALFDRRERDESSSLILIDHARALVHNAAGRYEAALDSAQRACDNHPLKATGPALVELVEAASRIGAGERARTALELLVDRTRLGGTDWALGLEARSAALVTDDPAQAEMLYVEAIDRLGRARTRPDLARAHLVYGEWLRREHRRVDARKQLRTALDLFEEMGTPGFAERTRRELAATGETVRKRVDATRGDLTAQEVQIARLASDGLTNPQIGEQLFLSPRTIEWHLRHIYPKLGIRSRRELASARHRYEEAGTRSA